MIFGKERPDFYINAAWWELSYVVFDDYKYQIPDYLEHKSIITGFKSFIALGDYSRFGLIHHIQKNASPANTFISIYDTFHGKMVDQFKPHIDGPAILDKNSNPVKFFVERVEPFYMDNLTTYDAVIIVLQAQSYVDLARTLENG